MNANQPYHARKFKTVKKGFNVLIISLLASSFILCLLNTAYKPFIIQLFLAGCAFVAKYVTLSIMQSHNTALSFKRTIDFTANSVLGKERSYPAPLSDKPYSVPAHKARTLISHGKSTILGIALILICPLTGMAWLPILMTGFMLIAGNALLLKKGHPPKWWYILIGAFIMISAWYLFRSEYFLKSMEPRLSYFQRFFLLNGDLAENIKCVFYITPFQMSVFIIMSFWDEWNRKIPALPMFFIYLGSCILGIVIASQFPVF